MAEEDMIQPEEGKKADRVLSFGNVPTVDLQQVEARPEAIAPHIGRHGGNFLPGGGRGCRFCTARPSQAR